MRVENGKKVFSVREVNSYIGNIIKNDYDVTKLCVYTRDIGLDGIEVYDILRDEYDIQIEFGDIGNIMAYISIGDRIQDIERLVGALADIARIYKKDSTGMLSGIHNPLCKIVLKEFYNFGAPEQILYINKPHIGTDNLINIIRNMRNEIIKLGGEFLFNEKVTDFEFENSKVTAVICGKRIETDTVILAIGHSARSTFEKLYEKGVKMEKKNFSIGVRIEHKQSMINKSQYGEITKLKLPPAEYKMAYHGENRSCYTFCMCPGGTVIASSSEPETIVTNGMSVYARNGENANSAVLVNVTPNDFKGESPLEGMYFQKDLEQKAFKLGGSNYNAPIQRFEDFENNVKSTHIGEIKPTYKPGVTLSNLNEILPDFISKTLIEGIKYFDKSIKGFAHPDAILTGVETRSSSPVQITRNENKQSNIKGLYPCGEGAGYAGGIMSAAVDGIKCAIAVLTQE